MSISLEEMESISFNVLMMLFLLMADINNLFGVLAITVLGNSYCSKLGLNRKVELLGSYKLSLLNFFMLLDFQDILQKILKSNLSSLKNKILSLISKRKSSKNFLSTNQTSISLQRLVPMTEFKNLV